MLPTFKTQDEIPEAFRDAYEEKDGVWTAKVEDVSALKDTIKAEREKREAAEKLVKKQGDELKKAETKAKAAEAGLTDEQLEKMRATLRAELLEEVTPKLQEAERIAAENRKLTFDDAGKKIAADAGFLPTKLDDLWRLHGDEFDLTADKKLMVKGNPAMEPKKHMEALTRVRPEWVQGSQAGGGGAAGFNSGAPPKVESKAPPEQRLAAAFAAGAKE